MIFKLAEKSLIPPSVFSEFLSMHPNNTQESNHSSGANGFSSKISRIAHFAVMMSEYGELTSVQDANREQRNPTNVSHKTKQIDHSLKRKKIKAWKQYLEKVGIELTKRHQDERYVCDLLDSVGKAMAITFNSGYDYASMQQWLRDIFNFLHQSRTITTVEKILKNWLDNISSKTPSFGILVLATFVVHVAFVSKSFTQWQNGVLHTFMTSLLYKNNASDYAAFKSVFIRFYDFFYLGIISHFDKIVISRSLEATQSLFRLGTQ